MRHLCMVILLIGLVSPAANAAILDFPDFSEASSLTLNRDASIVPGDDQDLNPFLRVTPRGSSTVGSVFSTEPVDISRFHTHFSFRLKPSTADSRFGADGFVFAIQRSGPTAIGDRGGNMGFHSMPSPPGSRNFGVEFDTFRNVANDNDTSHSHIGIDIQTKFSVITQDVDPPFDNGDLWHAWIDYDGKTIDIRVDNGTDPITTLSYPIDLRELLGSKFAHVGFTAATGGADVATHHDVISWRFVPSPASGSVLMLACGWVAAGTRRIRRNESLF